MATTLEILAPYLPYQLDVFVARDPQSLSGGVGRLIGLLPDRRGQHQATIGYTGADGTAAYNDRALAGQWVGLHRILPILRPFSQLCDPLSDGTIPACEAAKFSGATDFFTGPFVASIVEHPPMGRAVIVRNGEHEEARGIFWIYENKMAMIASWPCIVSDAWRYLRFHHFAVGLEPHEFIGKGASHE